jgi:hypothetical protein
MTSLFPVTDEGFKPKADTGVLASYCERCGLHLSRHGTVWRVATGSVRACPTSEIQIAALRDLPLPPPSELVAAGPSVYITNPPFGTTFNATAEKLTTGRRTIAPPNTVAIGEVATEAVPRRRPDDGHLRGAAVHHTHAGASPITKAIPCRRSNESQLHGAAITY